MLIFPNNIIWEKHVPFEQFEVEIFSNKFEQIFVCVQSLIVNHSDTLSLIFNLT